MSVTRLSVANGRAFAPIGADGNPARISIVEVDDDGKPTLDASWLPPHDRSYVVDAGPDWIDVVDTVEEWNAFTGRGRAIRAPKED